MLCAINWDGFSFATTAKMIRVEKFNCPQDVHKFPEFCCLGGRALSFGILSVCLESFQTYKNGKSVCAKFTWIWG